MRLCDYTHSAPINANHQKTPDQYMKKYICYENVYLCLSDDV